MTWKHIILSFILFLHLQISILSVVAVNDPLHSPLSKKYGNPSASEKFESIWWSSTKENKTRKSKRGPKGSAKIYYNQEPLVARKSGDEKSAKKSSKISSKSKNNRSVGFGSLESDGSHKKSSHRGHRTSRIIALVAVGMVLMYYLCYMTHSIWTCCRPQRYERIADDASSTLPGIQDAERPPPLNPNFRQKI